MTAPITAAWSPSAAREAARADLARAIRTGGPAMDIDMLRRALDGDASLFETVTGVRRLLAMIEKEGSARDLALYWDTHVGMPWVTNDPH